MSSARSLSDRILAVFLVLGLSSATARSDVTVAVLGATAEEISQLNSKVLLEIPDNAGMVSLCDEVLRLHPGNRAARLLRARSLLALGELDAGLKDLETLEGNSPGFPRVMPALADAYEAAGKKVMAAEILERYVKSSPTDRQEAELLKSSIPWLKARICELRGVNEEAESILTNLISTSQGLDKVSAQTAMGRFQLRRGEPGKAAGFLKSALDEARKSRPSGDTTLGLANDLALALWLDGRAKEAIALAKEMAGSVNPEQVPGRDVPGRVVLQYHFLAHISGDEKQREDSDALLGAAARGIPTDKKAGLDLALLVLGNKADGSRASKRIAELLKVAPGLEWASWSALYLGVARPQEAGDLLKALPAESLQGRLAAAAVKATAQTSPSRPGGPQLEQR